MVGKGNVSDDDPLDPLVERVRDGDPDAVADVYREVAPGLRAFLRSQVRHGEIADDLVESTFVELIEARRSLKGDGRSLRTWLYRAARNNLYDWRRRAARRADHELTPEHEAELVDPDTGPADQTEVAEQTALVLDAMAELSEDQREVLQLRLLSELSSREVAEATGRTVGAVKALQHRGMRSLARVLEERGVNAGLT